VKVYKAYGKYVLQIGFGLIGSAVYDRLRLSEGFYHHSSLAVPWEDQTESIAAVRQILTELKSMFPVDRDAPKELTILWSAGRTSFASSEVKCKAELATYTQIVRALSQELPIENWQVRFVLCSSAGGVYEGIGQIKDLEKVSPCRPYGVQKLAQEQVLQEIWSSRGASFLILRVSSVYGSLVSGHRKGLIDNLICNTRRHLPTNIFGQPDTLCDFVFAGDVADQIARSLQDFPKFDVQILASGKPASIFAVIKMVERQLGRKPYVSFTSEHSLANHIVYPPAMIESTFKSTSLSIGVAKILMQS